MLTPQDIQLLKEHFPTKEDFARLEYKIDDLQARMTLLEQRMDQLEARMAHLEKRMDRLELRMEKLEDKMDELTQDLKGFKIKTEKRFDTLTDKVDGTFHFADAINNQKGKIQKKLKVIEKHLKLN